MGSKKPIEVAIIGGGCASIAAAFELTRPRHKGAYHVTIYQLGWRLGGKGASGRGPAGRIEEHGLHVWLGCYDNAFQLLRECYDELNAKARKAKGRDRRREMQRSYREIGVISFFRTRTLQSQVSPPMAAGSIGRRIFRRHRGFQATLSTSEILLH